MKFAVQAVIGLSLVCVNPAFAAPAAPAAPITAPDAAHLQAVQDLLRAMQIEKSIPGIAARSRYQSEAQRQAVYAKLDKVPSAEVYQRMAPPLVSVISTDTAIEMTRFYTTPYGKKVIHQRYNSGARIMMPGMKMAVPPEEKEARKSAAYVKASTELAAAEPAVEHEAFNLLQSVNKEKR
jgi:hypothetical protein